MKANYHTTWLHKFGLIAAALLMLAVQAESQAAHSKHALKLRQVQSFEHLKRLMKAKTIRNSGLLSPRASADALFSAAENTVPLDFSQTNVQVHGVDEGDTVKTDGRFIYRIQGGKVQIVRAQPAAQMTTLAELNYDSAFGPVALYIDGDRLVVIGNGWLAGGESGSLTAEHGAGTAIFPPWRAVGESRTAAKVYDISDRSQPNLEREIEFSGDYLSSRKIDNNIYLIGRKYPNYFISGFAAVAERLPAGKKKPVKMTRANLLPHVSDSTIKNGAERILPLANVFYFPGFVEPDYTIVAGFDLSDPNRDADIKAYLGGGDITYASARNLYVSAADYGNVDASGQQQTLPVTHLYKFALNAGTTSFTAAGEVPGVALNSFSMDEHNGYFRIATTVDQWNSSDDTSSLQTWNNLYTLDEHMQIVGRLEHLSEGERLFASRFIGDRSYLVTFEQVDPLFVIDLSVPSAPKVLGELKIPGFSSYLHPFDENHIIGFGQDAADTAAGAVTGGLKLALFDVTDVAHPSQLHSLTIGKQGSYSPLLYDHKALLFNKQRGLLGFPVSVTANKSGQDWPVEVFQGAYIFHVSLEHGFQKQAAISHQPAGDNSDWNRAIQRLLRIGDTLYTLSDARIQANALLGFEEIGGLDFPIETPPDCVLPDPVALAGTAVAGDCAIFIDPPQ